MKYLPLQLINILITIILPTAHASEATELRLSDSNRLIEIHVGLDDQSKSWLLNKKELIVAVTSPDFPPFTIRDSDNQLQGITAEYLSSLQRALGIPIKLQSYPSRDEAFKALRDGNVDLVDTASINESQKYGVILTDAYSYTRAALYSKTGDLLNIDINDHDMKVSTTDDGLVADELTARFTNGKHEEFKSPIDAISSVLHGDAKAYLGDTVTTNFLVNQNFSNLLVTNKILDSVDQDVGFAIRPNELNLKRIVNQALATRKICDKNNDIKWWVSSIECKENNFHEQLSLDEKNLLKKNQTYKISISEDFAPYAFFDSLGQFNGALSDILEKIRLETGLKFNVIRTHSIDSAIKDLDTDHADLSLLAQTEERGHKYIFTSPIFNTPYTFITKKKKASDFVLNATDFKTLAIPRSDALENYVKSNYPNIKLKPTETVADALKMVRDGDAEFSIISTNQSRYFLAYKYEKTLAIAGIFMPRTAKISLAGRPDSKVLISIIQKSLKNISPGEISIITGRWQANSATDARYWEGISLRIYQTLSGLFVLLAITGIWIVLLRKLIFKRTIERKQLQSRLKLKQNMVNSIPHPIYVRDSDGTLLLFNTAYAQTFTQNNDSTIGGPALDKLVDASMFRRWQASYLAVIQSGIAISEDQHLQTQNGEYDIYHWIEPLRDDNERIIGVVCGWLDIGSRLQILEELREAKESADNANNSKSIFLATMSHEIRTPMNAIIGMLELVLARDKTKTRNREAIKVAHSSAINLLELLGAILDVSSIEAGQAQLQSEVTTWRKIIEPVVEVFRGSARQKNLSIIIELDASVDYLVSIDRLKVKQILSNLLSNAIKFTDSGDIIVILSGNYTENTFEFVLTVKDKGSGISESEIPTLFTPFARTKATKNSGAGLGLSICNSLTQLMGGRLLVISSKAMGTSVSLCVCLPRFEPHCIEEVCIEPATSTTGTSSMNVLIAEDHTPSLHLLQEQLEVLGHKAILANNGLEALFQWEDADIDLVITDFNMPEMTGEELAFNIRSRERELKIKPSIIVGLTASARKEDIQLCLEGGMDFCFVKPINIELLTRFVPDLRLHQAKNDDSLGSFLKSLDSTKRQIRIKELITSNEADFQKYKIALKAMDLPKISQAIHRLKGAALILSAVDLFNYCNTLEASMNASDNQTIALTSADVLESILEEIKSLLLKI